MSALDVVLPDGSRRTSEALLSPWLKRAESGRKARKPLEGEWMMNAAFAAGNQWAVYLPKEHRVLAEDPRRKANKRSMQTADVLTQYVWTAIGKLAADDFRPQLLADYGAKELAERYAEAANKSFGWGWDEEWKGDEVLLDLLLTVATFGTAAIRARYDRTKGQLVGDVPHAPTGGYTHSYPQSPEDVQAGMPPRTETFEEGKPILDPEAARAFVADRKTYGEPIDLRQLREGEVVWEVLSPWNLLVPPAVEHAKDFPWEIVVRPVAIEDLQEMYGDKAQGVKAEEVQAMDVLGLNVPQNPSSTSQMNGSAPASAAKLEDHALVYTGYQPPTRDFPKGLQICWAGDDTMLDVTPQLPLQKTPWGSRSGITYFHYWKVKQRFFARGLYDAGRGPQRTRNKRISQIDEIIDRGLPKVYGEEGSIDLDELTGNPVEFVFVKQGAPLPRPDGGIAPGDWMKADVELQDLNLQKALGINDIGLGNAPPGVSAYSAMALMTENDATKLDPIAKGFKIGTADLGRDTLELMGNWPDGKTLMIVGEDDELENFTFKRAMLPPGFMCKPAKGGTLPRSQAAEIQKIADLWNAAAVSGAVGRDPNGWLRWYKQSLDAGKAQDLPDMDSSDEQRHKAALENVVMVRTGQVLPVAPYDDAQIHDEEHREMELKLSEAAAMGDEHAASLVPVIQQHREMHAQMAQQNAAQNAPLAAQQQQQGAAPVPPQFINQAQAPIPPSVRV